MRAVMGRMRIDLAAALQRLGSSGTSPTTLARTMNMDRATAHRLLDLATTTRGNELGAVARAPGPEGIDAFLLASRRRGASADALAGLAHALEQYRKLLLDLGGSKARLIRRIEATLPAATADDPPRTSDDVSRRLFEAATDLLGRRNGLRLDVMIVRRIPDRPDVFDLAQVRGVLGHVASPHALPMSIDLLGRALRPDAPAPPGLLTLSGRPATSALSSTVLPAFSTTPLPVVLSQGVGERVRNVIDPRASKGAPVDVVLGYRRDAAFRHPRFEDSPMLEVGALVRDPTERLIVDVFVERDVAREAVPDGEAYVWSPTLETSLADHWLDKLPGAPPLQVLGAGLERAESRLWPRHGELLKHAFDELRWDPRAFVGFRLEVEGPLWGCAYFVVLDFARAPSRVPAGGPTKRAGRRFPR